MTRTKGAGDLRRRSRRSDRGKLRKIYAGKKTKPKRKVHGRFVPYISKRSRGDPVKIWFQEKKRIRKEGYVKLPANLRKMSDKMSKTWIDRPTLVDPEDISTPEKIGEIAIEILKYPGLFNLTMPSHSKNRFGVSYKKKAVIKITETKEGLHAEVSNYSQMKHYGFFKK